MVLFGVVTKKILMVVYVLDSRHPLLSSQASLVVAIAREVESLHVIAGSVGHFECPDNVKITSLSPMKAHFKYKPFNKLGKLFLLVRISKRIIESNSMDVVFVHMADIFAAVLSLSGVFDTKKIFLWYAHTSKSIWARICRFRGISFLSSTSGSFPFNDVEVQYLGQIVKASAFPLIEFRREIHSLKEINLCHIGRLDKSKNLHLIILTLVELKKIEPRTITFNQYGEATPGNEKYMKSLVDKINKIPKNLGLKVSLRPNILNQQVASVLEQHDIFIHAYEGSLDKALIEATLSGIPVITANKEYLRIFGSWCDDRNVHDNLAASDVIIKEWLALCSMNAQYLHESILERSKIAKQQYSEENWLRNFFYAIDTNTLNTK